MRAVRSFPWHLLARVRKRDERLFRSVRQGFEREREALRRAIESLVSSPCTLTAGKSWSSEGGIVHGSDPGRPTGIVLRSGPLYWIVEEAFAARLLTHTLRVEADKITDRTKATTPAVAGGLAAIAEFLARHTAYAPVYFAPAPLPKEHTLFSRFHLEVSTPELQRYSLWCAMDPSTSLPLREDRDAGDRDLELPLSLPLVLATLAFEQDVFSAVSAGDAVLLGRATLAGEAHLSPPGIDWGWSVQLDRTEDQRIKVVLGQKRGDLPFMPSDTLSDLALEAPVLVRVEIGSVELQARAWSDLRAGDTLALGVSLGNPVTLRVGTKIVGRGELVDIEGELGVRLLERND